MNVEAHPILDYAECAIEREARRFECEFWPTCGCPDGTVAPDCPALIRLEGVNKRKAHLTPLFWVVAGCLLFWILVGSVALAAHRVPQIMAYQQAAARV